MEPLEQCNVHTWFHCRTMYARVSGPNSNTFPSLSFFYRQKRHDTFHRYFTHSSNEYIYMYVCINMRYQHDNVYSAWLVPPTSGLHLACTASGNTSAISVVCLQIRAYISTYTRYRYGNNSSQRKRHARNFRVTERGHNPAALATSSY